MAFIPRVDFTKVSLYVLSLHVLTNTFCVSAFKEVFDLFDSNGGGTIDAEELDLALRSVGICLSEDDIIGVLESMDKDGTKICIFIQYK